MAKWNQDAFTASPGLSGDAALIDEEKGLFPKAGLTSMSPQLSALVWHKKKKKW